MHLKLQSLSASQLFNDSPLAGQKSKNQVPVAVLAWTDSWKQNGNSHTNHNPIFMPSSRTCRISVVQIGNWRGSGTPESPLLSHFEMFRGLTLCARKLWWHKSHPHAREHVRHVNSLPQFWLLHQSKQYILFFSPSRNASSTLCVLSALWSFTSKSYLDTVLFTHCDVSLQRFGEPWHLSKTCLYNSYPTAVSPRSLKFSPNADRFRKGLSTPVKCQPTSTKMSVWGTQNFPMARQKKW